MVHLDHSGRKSAQRHRKSGGKSKEKSPLPTRAYVSPLLDRDELVARARQVEKTLRTGEIGPSEAELREKMSRRTELVPRADPVGLERVLGRRNIQSIAYMQRGLRAARAVCRIKTLDPGGSTPAYGTGFLVGPGLLLTNHHVLRNVDDANRSLAEFDYELDLNFVEKRGRIFSFVASEVFYTNPELDYTFVGLVPIGHDNTPLTDFGYLPLLQGVGKVLSGEYVTIIQHPQGGTKQVVLRENQLLPEVEGDNLTGKTTNPVTNEIQKPNFIRYLTDTEPGSSGSPVFNDQWDVIALHHSSIPAFDKDKDLVTVDDRGRTRKWLPEMGEDRIKWIANEGVRVSAIMRTLQQAAVTDDDAMRALRRMVGTTRSRGDRSMIEPEEPVAPEGTALDVSRFQTAAYRKTAGYDEKFLGGKIPLPKVRDRKLASQIAETRDRKKQLDYTHFSVVMHKQRRVALFTAVNIDGASRSAKKRTSVRWRADPRMDEKYQTLADVYGESANGRVQLDRGHLVRRLDPVWEPNGNDDLLEQAEEDTFHYTNAAPQEHGFNDKTWGNLEDYVLSYAEGQLQRVKGRHARLSVFTGPVLREDDREYGVGLRGGPWRIPNSFWKVVVFRRPDQTLSVSAFKLDQTEAVDPLFERYAPYTDAQARTFQVRLTMIETLTGLDFGAVMRKADAYSRGALESTRALKPILGRTDIVL